MDLLKTLAFPQPTEHYHLLLLMLALIFTVFVPYAGFVLGTTMMSIRLRRRATDPAGRTLATRLADLAVHDKQQVWFLGVIPALALVFVYAQLLQQTPAIAVSLMTFAFAAIAGGFGQIRSYRQMLLWEDVTSRVDSLTGKHRDEIQGVSDDPVRTGMRGVLLLGGGMFLVVGATVEAADPSSWASIQSVLDLFASGAMWLRFGAFLALSAGATGVGMLYFLGDSRGGETVDVQLVRTLGIRCATWSMLSFPVLLVATVWLLPTASLSGLVFAVTGACILVLFLAAHFLYAYSRDTRPSYAAYAFYTLACAFVLNAFNDHVAISNATRSQAVILAALHEKETEALKVKLGVGAPALTGQDIYNGKCSACHLFDQKKIGPAYRDVIPKYAGKKNELMAFVLNPRKMDPNFPPMPNQGLKPAEADSIVTFLLAKFAPATPEAKAK
jgi:cytochrome c